MGIIKDKYRQFRRWQENPFVYQDSHDAHQCCNCGREMENNYCPRCGQKAVYGPISWRSVWQGVLDVWGVGTRSLPYTLWQLIWRPGYLIRDYISGKRQVSFPPVKMLVIVALLVFFVGQFLFPEYWGIVLDEQPEPVTSTGVSYYVDSAISWLATHPEWGVLFLFSFLILPTWFVFRHAPRNPRHTLPQGFFVQVFMSIQFFIWNFVLSLALLWTGMNGQQAWVVSACFLPLMVVLDYKQLFGYSKRGTLWRVAVVVATIVLSLLLMVMIVVAIQKPDGYIVERHFRPIFVFMEFAAIFGTLLSLTDAINRRNWKERGVWRSMMLPLLFFMAMVICLIVLEIQRPGAFFKALFS